MRAAVSGGCAAGELYCRSTEEGVSTRVVGVVGVVGVAVSVETKDGVVQCNNQRDLGRRAGSSRCWPEAGPSRPWNAPRKQLAGIPAAAHVPGIHSAWAPEQRIRNPPPEQSSISELCVPVIHTRYLFTDALNAATSLSDSPGWRGRLYNDA